MKSPEEWRLELYKEIVVSRKLEVIQEIQCEAALKGHTEARKLYEIIVKKARREAAEEMQTICLGMLAEFATPQAQYIKLDQIIRSLPLPGEEGYDKVYAEWISSDGHVALDNVTSFQSEGSE